MTPMQWAAMRGHKPVIEWLLSSGVPVDEHLGRYETALLVAVRAQRHEIVTYLIQRGALAYPRRSYAQGGTRDSPLAIALENDDTKMIDILIDAGADPNNPHPY